MPAIALVRHDVPNLVQLRLIRAWTLARGELHLDLAKEPFLRKQLERLAEPVPTISPEPRRGPGRCA